MHARLSFQQKEPANSYSMSLRPRFPWPQQIIHRPEGTRGADAIYACLPFQQQELIRPPSTFVPPVSFHGKSETHAVIEEG